MELKISPINFEDFQGQLKPLALKAINQAKTISFSISQKEQEQKEQEHIINKPACVSDQLQVDVGHPSDDYQTLAYVGHPSDDYQVLVCLVPIDELNGYLGYMYYIYCNWQSDTPKTSLIIVDVNDYNKGSKDKGSKDFTVQLLNTLYERTNEKKVTNHE